MVTVIARKDPTRDDGLVLLCPVSGHLSISGTRRRPRRRAVLGDRRERRPPGLRGVVPTAAATAATVTGISPRSGRLRLLLGPRRPATALEEAGEPHLLSSQPQRSCPSSSSSAPLSWRLYRSCRTAKRTKIPSSFHHIVLFAEIRIGRILVTMLEGY